jgi:hypothetical protein
LEVSKPLEGSKPQLEIKHMKSLTLKMAIGNELDKHNLPEPLKDFILEQIKVRDCKFPVLIEETSNGAYWDIARTFGWYLKTFDVIVDFKLAHGYTNRFYSSTKRVMWISLEKTPDEEIRAKTKKKFKLREFEDIKVEKL